DMNATQKTPLIGDWASLPDEPVVWKTSSMPPNFTLGHFRGFAKASGDAFWMDSVEAIQTLITGLQSMYSKDTGLLSLYLRGAGPLTPPAGKLLGDANDGSFVAEAGSVPFRLVTDYLASGDARSKAALGKMNDWIKTKTGGDATKIVDGYKLDGTPIGTKGTMAFIAPFGASALIDAGNQAWLDALWKQMTASGTVSNDPDTANVLGMLVASGNWWGP